MKTSPSDPLLTKEELLKIREALLAWFKSQNVSPSAACAVCSYFIGHIVYHNARSLASGMDAIEKLTMIAKIELAINFEEAPKS